MFKIDRRQFLKRSVMGTAGLAVWSGLRGDSSGVKRFSIRLGGPVFREDTEPVRWVAEHKRLGYSAAYCPVESDAPPELVRAFEVEAKKTGLVIAEVGAWSNPISPDEKVRKEAFTFCCNQLDLADRIGALCCVNIAGSRNPERWDGPHPDNLTEETFDSIVEVTRKIIDEVKPTRTFWTLETMPWVFPDSVESYVRLTEAMNREAFAVHLDPVNLINTPSRYFRNSDLIRNAFRMLGPRIRSCHGKDIRMEDGFPVHIQECRPGLGKLDYAVYLDELSKLPQQPPLMLEHLETPGEYEAAAIHVRNTGRKNRLEFSEIE
jgi:sugar phosphate isomerase/epimerase